MTEIAQTNLQLYNQLIVGGWSDTELARARGAYELATDLFAGQLRPSGKTFIAHLVGTASALAVTNARVDLVNAGLLHAAYTHGEFGDGRRNATGPKRAIVRAAIGPAAESLVDGYAAVAFTRTFIEDPRWRTDSLSPTARDLAVLRLANEVDEHADLGGRYCDRGGDPMRDETALAAMADLAEQIDQYDLAEMLRRSGANERGAKVPAVLRSSLHRSWTSAPRSYRLRFEIALRRTTVVAQLRRFAVARRAYRTVRGGLDHRLPAHFERRRPPAG